MHWRARFGDGQNKENQTSSVSIFCHHGSHVDAPYHLFPEGRRINEFAVTDFIFQKPLLIHLPKDNLEEITSRELEPYREELAPVRFGPAFDRLFPIPRPGAGPVRPGIPGPLARGRRVPGTLRPAMRCFGVDTISVENIPRGRERKWPVHKILLGSRPDFLAIEDIRLTEARERHLHRVLAMPLRLPTEASPATVIAEVD